jgi:hypothetical protein
MVKAGPMNAKKATDAKSSVPKDFFYLSREF